MVCRGNAQQATQLADVAKPAKARCGHRLGTLQPLQGGQRRGARKRPAWVKANGRYKQRT